MVATAISEALSYLETRGFKLIRLSCGFSTSSSAGGGAIAYFLRRHNHPTSVYQGHCGYADLTVDP
jgi:hypothetical protein